MWHCLKAGLSNWQPMVTCGPQGVRLKPPGSCLATTPAGVSRLPHAPLWSVPALGKDTAGHDIGHSQWCCGLGQSNGWEGTHMGVYCSGGVPTKAYSTTVGQEHPCRAHGSSGKGRTPAQGHSSVQGVWVHGPRGAFMQLRAWNPTGAACRVCSPC